MSDYSFVVVPEQFEFVKGKDQYQLNSMTKFYLEKNGFNPYFESEIPNADRCEGLYANVEELGGFFGTKLQLVLKDCNGAEIYRSPEGKSKYKDFEKTYQDALRKTLENLSSLNVKQKDVQLFKKSENIAETPEIQLDQNISENSPSRNSPSKILPSGKFSKYVYSNNSYLLRKTTEGYSLYEESKNAPDGLLLKGKIIVLGEILKYLDTTGKTFNVSFDASQNMTITDGNVSMVYKIQD
ncbi:hypothetical protein KIV10_00295 [Aequorivita echinoideorum]|uniref:Uncharacterized protein n=1 Tax=Aequorivita echinoideorum TaxID=1549647 RepID=A0ABS5S066_9FLAO|nr:hypothetical protein [Aequorivita echinoideorum]